MTSTDAQTPSPAAKLTETERLKQAKAKIEARLREIATRENAAKRKAETKGKIILGALAFADDKIRSELAAKASERDQAHLRSLGWL